ncbi:MULTISPECIES: hypothetical protein [Mycolicibacterium]|jgi:hypothetical protein|nr:MULTISPECIES: hypothetical protein [Mycolicibacterium]
MSSPAAVVALAQYLRRPQVARRGAAELSLVKSRDVVYDVVV